MFDGLSTLPETRLAHPGDEAALFDCLLALESDNAMLPRSDERVWQVVRRACSCDGAVAGIVEQDGKIVASVGIVLADVSWYSDAVCLREIWLFVRPEARRGGKCAEALWAFMVAHRDDMRQRTGDAALDLITGPTSAKRLPAKMRWWGKRARLIGASYLLGAA